jgi:protein subunit release factor A
MTNKEAIFLLRPTLDFVISEYFKVDSKAEITKELFHASKKSFRALESVWKSKGELESDTVEAFKKENNLDLENKSKDELDKINKEFFEYRSVQDNIKHEIDFINSECKVELHKVSEDQLEACVLPYETYSVLSDFLTNENK